jgi:hypothetical protein
VTTRRRVMRARKRSRCGLCAKLVLPGAQIAYLAGQGWVHSACIVEVRLRRSAARPTVIHLGRRGRQDLLLQPTVGSRITRSAWRVIELKSTVCRPGRSIAQVCTPSAGGTVEMSTV